MARITVARGGDGSVKFAVSWAEPIRAEFTSRLEAERFAAWLRTTGLTVDVDGSCAPCSAHHASGHGCPSCGAHLGLRVAPAGAIYPRPPATFVPDPYLIPREQHRIRVALAAQARAERLAATGRLLASESVAT